MHKDPTSSTPTPVVADPANQHTVNMDQDEYEKFRQWVADTKSRNIKDKLKEMKDKVTQRRQTLVMRRVDIKCVAPDEDVAAYQEIYKLKNPSGDSKNKTFVTDNEIDALKVLCPRFDTIPTLSEITAKVEELKAAGQLTAEGDKVSADEDQV
jgi:hypothetical protein